MRAECGSCHGSGAAQAGGGIRFDFYDLNVSACGKEIVDALADVSGARNQTDAIAKAITTADASVRPIMPPAPAPYLTDNQWLTILRWTARPFLGDKPPNDLPPRISVEGTPFVADQTLDVHAVVDDPEGEPVVGILKVGDWTGPMDHSGAFSARLDTSSWPAGLVTVSAVLCDGWSQVSAPLLTVEIKH